MSVERLKHVAEVRISNVDKKTVDGELPIRLCNYMDVYYNERITAELNFMPATASPEQRRVFALRPGDVVLTKDSETADDIGTSALVADEVEDLICGYHLALVRPRPERAHGPYLRWVLASHAARQAMSMAATGVTRFGLRSEAIAELEIPLPPLHEQRAIADYLDRETARIDAVIAAKQRMKELVAERRDAQLRLLVDPESNLATHVVPVRRVLHKRERVPIAPGVVTAFRDGRVMARSRRRVVGFTESETRAGYQGVEEGDIVFHGLDGFAGAIGVSEDQGSCSPVYHVCTAQPGFDALYVALALRALAISGYLSLQSGNVRERAVDFRNWETLARIPIALPSLDAQVEQARAFVKRRTWTERLTARLDNQIDLLAELRQGLVTATVTGHFDVPVAA